MIWNKVIFAIPGWQNSAVRTCWENQLFMSVAGCEKASSKRTLAGNFAQVSGASWLWRADIIFPR